MNFCRRADQTAGLTHLLLTEHDTLAAAEHGEEGWYAHTVAGWVRGIAAPQTTT